MAKITIKDVAAMAGVSVSTVSRVLNKNATVDSALAEKVFEAVRTLGYQQGMTSRILRGEPTHQIAFIVPALENTYFSSVTAGVLDAAAENGQQVLMLKSDSDAKQEDSYFHMLSQLPVDGIIFASSNGQDPIKRFPELKKKPLVIAARRHITDGVPHIYADNTSAGYLATKYLLRLNHKRIALFANSWGKSLSTFEEFEAQQHSPNAGGFTALDRYAGYRAALEEEGIEFDPGLIIFSGYSFEDGYEAAQSLLAGSVEFDAILAPNDRVAAGIMKLLNEQNINVPEQISLICLNSGLIAEVMTPQLTLIRQDNYRLGVESVNQLNKLIRGEKAEDVKISVQLMIRGSTSARHNNETV